MIPTSWRPCSSIRLLMQVSTSALSVDPGGYGWLPGCAAQYYPASDESDRGQQAQEHFPAREREHSAVFAFTFTCGGGQSLFKSLTLVHGSGDHTGQFIQRIQGVRISVLMNGSVRLVGFQLCLRVSAVQYAVVLIIVVDVLGGGRQRRTTQHQHRDEHHHYGETQLLHETLPFHFHRLPTEGQRHFPTPRFPCTHLYLSVAVNRPLSNRLDALSPGGERGGLGMGGRLISEAALIGTPPMVW